MVILKGIQNRERCGKVEIFLTTTEPHKTSRKIIGEIPNTSTGL